MDEGQQVGIVLLVFITLFMCYVCLSKNVSDEENIEKVENFTPV
jgi:hypothetical protein